MSESELHRQLALTYQSAAKCWHDDARNAAEHGRPDAAAANQRRAAVMHEHARMQCNTHQALELRAVEAKDVSR